jgi:hypothetical protein
VAKFSENSRDLLFRGENTDSQKVRTIEFVSVFTSTTASEV